MRLSFVLALLGASLGLASPVDDTSPRELASPLEARDVDAAGQPLEKRACVSNGCRCVSGLRQGQYCGACRWKGNWVISARRNLNHIYECSPTGNCCSYGYARDCNTGSGRCGPY